MEGTGVESFRSKFRATTSFAALVYLETFAQGRQTKPVHMSEWFGPHKLHAPPHGGYDGEGLVEMGNDDNVPGVAGQGAREETGCIVDKMGDDHFDYFRGKPGSRGRARRRSLRVNTPREDSPDPGWGSVPNSFGE